MTVVNSVIIRRPVSFADVNKVLGASHTDLGLLCKDSHINMWAKYKPVKHSATGLLTDAQRKNVNYGIKNIPVWTGNGAVNKMGNFWFGYNTSSTNYPVCGLLTDYWTYERPTGGASSPYRLADFVKDSGNTYGYKHNVVAPIGACTLSSIKISATGSITIPFSGNGSGQTDGYTVPLGDLTGDGVYTGLFETLYMSVMIHKKNSNIYYVGSRDDNWGTDMSTSVTKTVPTAAVGTGLVGTCEVFPFLSTKKFTALTSNLSGETGPVVAMFEKREVTVSIQYAKSDISEFAAYYENTSAKVLYSQFTLTNNCGAPYRVSYTVYFSSQSTFPSSDTITATGSIYMAAGASEAVQASVNIPAPRTAANYVNGYSRIVVTAQSGYDIMFKTDTSDSARITQGLPR